MGNAIIALVLFVAALGGLALFYGKLGKLSFWKLAATFPEKAFEHFTNDPAWVVLQGSESMPGAGFTGPFLLPVPSLGRTLKLYAREDQMEASQKRFIEMHRALLPQWGFPYLSPLALLYPVEAILSMSNTPAPSVLILGYGFANLGYLLGVATIIPGHFRILGLDERITTLISAIVFWVIGLALSNAI
ncbi:MAG: hypothetical protein H8K05_14445 [Nitrospira sp.]|nr:hypothetical protein [Nitrospira sp.]